MLCVPVVGAVVVDYSQSSSTDKTCFIAAHDLSWSMANGTLLFKQVSFSIGREKVGLVGRNGVGKTTLLKLIVGELSAPSHQLRVNGRFAYLPQNFRFNTTDTVADVLGVSDKLAALTAIHAGSVEEKWFDCLNEQWDIEQRIAQLLQALGLSYLDLDRRFNSLSGGEATRIYLAGLLLSDADVLILDEPTNNLDLQARQALYALVDQWEKTLIVVSHDRTLLNRMDRIIELSPLGTTSYGGNYDDYLLQSHQQREAMLKELSDAKAGLKKAKRTIQANKEKHEQKQARGKKQRRSGSQSKLLMDARKERSEKTRSRMTKSGGSAQLSSLQQCITDVWSELDESAVIEASFAPVSVAKGKVVLEVDNLTLGYQSTGHALIDSLSFTVIGPERVWLKGRNGCGKTTLLNTIQNAAKKVTKGVHIGVKRVVYLDQHVNVLEKDASILENFRRFQPAMPESDIRLRLAQFLFRNDSVFQLIRDLSGGERIRAALACLFMHDAAPELLLLDEPTNHLDLDAIASLESTLNAYRGAILLVTHDESFARNIHIEREINLDRC